MVGTSTMVNTRELIPVAKKGLRLTIELDDIEIGYDDEHCAIV